MFRNHLHWGHIHFTTTSELSKLNFPKSFADTMMKFATYENIVEMAYKHLIPTPKDQTSKPVQLGVSFGSGYVAGVFCAAISHPADNLVSFLNNAKGATVADVSAAAYLSSTLLLICENACIYSVFLLIYIRLSRTLASGASSRAGFPFASS
jgi:hypothetical protein